MSDILTVDKPCGCAEVFDADIEGWVLSHVCQVHEDMTEEHRVQLQRVLDAELDASVAEACGGRRVTPIRPRDESKR